MTGPAVATPTNGFQTLCLTTPKRFCVNWTKTHRERAHLAPQHGLGHLTVGADFFSSKRVLGPRRTPIWCPCTSRTLGTPIFGTQGGLGGRPRGHNCAYDLASEIPQPTAKVLGRYLERPANALSQKDRQTDEGKYILDGSHS